MSCTALTVGGTTTTVDQPSSVGWAYEGLLGNWYEFASCSQGSDVVGTEAGVIVSIHSTGTATIDLIVTIYKDGNVIHPDSMSYVVSAGTNVFAVPFFLNGFPMTYAVGSYTNVDVTVSNVR